MIAKMKTDKVTDQIENKLHISDVLIYLLFAGIMVMLVGTQKTNYHIDELYSYGLSNYTGGGY